MPANVSFQRLPLLGDEPEGHLVFVDDKLAAVVSRLDGEGHLTQHKGTWFIEAGFGPCAPEGPARLFQSLDQVGRWVTRRVSHGLDHCCGGCSG